MYFQNDWAVLIPMANEAETFAEFVLVMNKVLDKLESGKVYLVVDKASKDNIRELCDTKSEMDYRYETNCSTENRNVEDAYLSGYRHGLRKGHKFIIEMDAGLSQDPRAIPMFLRVLNEGNECAFGSRNINGGSNADSPFRRKFLSTFGTTLANLFLGTNMKDMTSGFQGFHANVVKSFLAYGLKSKAHFYQTELRYLLRYTRYMEVPIHYRAPSSSVSPHALNDSRKVFWYNIKQHWFGKRLAVRSNFDYGFNT